MMKTALFMAIAAWSAASFPLAAQEPRPAQAPARKKPAEKKEVTPVSLPGSEAFVYRKADGNDMRLFVVKPAGWAASDKRPGFVCFFGGGWISGTPERSIILAKWAAQLGMVGIAPDYRTRNRFKAQPEDCVADGRAAMRWIEEHAKDLGIDPRKLIVQGGSAGGHVAAWTAIPKNGPGKNDPAPEIVPAALVLYNPVTDTNDGGYGGTKRFGQAERARACSVPDQMPAKMPPTLVFHATGDKTVPYANSVAFRDKLVANGNRCELVTFQGLGHSYNSASLYGDAGKKADEKTRADIIVFLKSLGLLETTK